MTIKRVVFGLILLIALVSRLVGLEQVPPAPYWEEVALGYDAYSISETGRDHHGNWFPIVAFESFGDWKPGGYIYALVPFIKLLGLSVTTVRLPAALAGIFMVVGMHELARIWESRSGLKKGDSWFPIIVMAITAVSPWAITFSRAAWEVNLATCLILWAVVAGWSIIAGRLKPWWWIGVAALLIAAMYTYHAARIVGPALGLGLIVLWWIAEEMKAFNQGKWLESLSRFTQRHLKVVIVTAVLSLILLQPFILSLGSPVTSQRFAETSIFAPGASELVTQNQTDIRPHLTFVGTKLFYHRYLSYAKIITENFLSHFNPNYLFIKGDTNPRHSIQFMGQLYHIEALFLIAGVIVLFRRRQLFTWFLVGWLIIGVLPAAITLASPHSLRTLPTLPVWMMVIGLGIRECFTLGILILKRGQDFLNLKNKALPLINKFLVISLIIFLYVFEVSLFGRFYTGIYPKLYASEWQYGYQAVVKKIEDLQHQFPDATIQVTREFGRPAMYYWFYTQTDPRLVQAANQTAAKDQSEFLQFENLTFVRDRHELSDSAQFIFLGAEEADLLATSSADLIQIDEVSDLRQKPLWKVLAKK